VESGVGHILLVEPYYNGPSSIEIRREYMGAVAAEFPDAEFIPYVIPGRSGCQILPEDVGIMAQELDNVNAVKEATGNLHNMRRTREVCGDDFAILSGDDPLTLTMMTDEAIACSGCISVWSNVAPGAVSAMVAAALEGNVQEADRLNEALQPLFDIVTVKTQEESPWGPRLCKARNPLPVKTFMRLLGMPVGPCRRPLGRMTPQGLQVLLEAGLSVWQNNPEVLQPVADTFGVDIKERLTKPRFRERLTY
jgi:4-hydroxy-tetrahydrodipicolinate synthase